MVEKKGHPLKIGHPFRPQAAEVGSRGDGISHAGLRTRPAQDRNRIRNTMERRDKTAPPTSPFQGLHRQQRYRCRPTCCITAWLRCLLQMPRTGPRQPSEARAHLNVLQNFLTASVKRCCRFPALDRRIRGTGPCLNFPLPSPTFPLRLPAFAPLFCCWRCASFFVRASARPEYGGDLRGGGAPQIANTAFHAGHYADQHHGRHHQQQRVFHTRATVFIALAPLGPAMPGFHVPPPW